MHSSCGHPITQPTTNSNQKTAKKKHSKQQNTNDKQQTKKNNIKQMTTKKQKTRDAKHFFEQFSPPFLKKLLDYFLNFMCIYHYAKNQKS